MTSPNYLTASPKQGVELLIVPVPMGARNLRFLLLDPDRFSYQVNDLWSYIKLPEGSYTFLFASLSATEEQAREVVEECMDVSDSEDAAYLFKNYGDGNYNYFTALESLQSLLRSLGLDPSRNYAFLKID